MNRLLSGIIIITLAASPALAMHSNMDVSKAQAAELGVTFRSNKDGESGTKVWLEFQPKGALSNFTRVELEMSVGEKRVVAAPLLTSVSSDGKVSAYFSASHLL